DRKNEELVATCRAVSWRAAQTLEWANQSAGVSLLDVALNHLTLGRAALYEVLLSSDYPSFAYAAYQLSEAVSGLRRAGQQPYLPGGLLTHVWCSFAQASEQRRHGHEEEAVDYVSRAQAYLEEAL